MISVVRQYQLNSKVLFEIVINFSSIIIICNKKLSVVLMIIKISLYMSSEQQQMGQEQSKSLQKSNVVKNDSFPSPKLNNSLTSSIIKSSPVIQLEKQQPKQKMFQGSSVVQDNTSLEEENKKLRWKLKELSQRLDQELERAAENKIKMQSLSRLQHPQKPQTLELQNAYKLIERLQKSVKDFENKESYQISVKRIMDLESIIKKKDLQTQQLKEEIKTSKKIIREKEKLINELLQNAKKDKNITQDKELIERLKKKMKKIVEENQELRKKQLSKHQQLVKAERKIVVMEQVDEVPIAREESLVIELEEMKKKYKQAMQRVDRLNAYVAKLNERLDKETTEKNKGRFSQGDKSRREVSKSLDELPSISKNKAKPLVDLIEMHLPAPKAQIKLKRY